jgi:hypothetical protein
MGLVETNCAAQREGRGAVNARLGLALPRYSVLAKSLRSDGVLGSSLWES